MSSFFGGALGGNPFSSVVGSKIEQATDGSLASENWALNMEICDLINETEDGPRDAIKAVRKRLSQYAGKNYTVIMYTLTILETCVKNCGKRFHVLACSKDFIQELVKLIGPKNDPPTAVQEKVLSLIQSWADAFRQQPDLSGVVNIYQDLLTKGIEFPATDLDAMAPIFTPQRSVEAAMQENDIHSSISPQIPSPTGGILNSEQRAKVQSELDVVQSNMTVFGELLNEMSPGKEHPEEMELLLELNVTCHGMQERLVDLISQLSNDEITAELLRINDDLNNLFLRFSRWEKNKEAGGQSASAVLAKALPSKNTDDSLIDLGGPDVTDQFNTLNISSPPATTHLAHIEPIAIRNTPQGDEFDVFAKSRNISDQNSGVANKDNSKPDQTYGEISSGTILRQLSKPSDFDEIEQWLEHTSVPPEESVTSSEFDRFLAERAAAAETLPNISTSNTIASSTSQSTASVHSKPTKDSKSDGLLAL